MLYIALIIMAVGFFYAGFNYCRYQILGRLRSRAMFIDVPLPVWYVVDIIMNCMVKNDTTTATKP